MEVIQINIASKRPISSLDVISILSKFETSILDLYYIDVHGTFSLTIVIEFPHLERKKEFVKEILYLGYLKDFIVQVNSIDEKEYEDWVKKRQKKNFILTVLGWEITGVHLKEVLRLIEKNGLSISFVNRLSDLKSSEEKKKSISCFEFYLKGDFVDLDKIHSDILDLSQRLEIDLGFQEDNIYRRHRRLIAFDMDSTLIKIEVIDELAKRKGVYDKVCEITKRAMEGEIDFKQSLKERVSLLKGLELDVLEQVARDLPLTDGAYRLIKTLKILGYKVAIISGGFLFFGNRLKNTLGIDYVFANDLEIRDGKLTGKVRGEIIDGPKKAEILVDLAKRENISLKQVIAVGDGMNDLPMLKIAGLGIAFRAKPLVKKGAKQSISNVGLDGILYFLGLKETELANLTDV